MQDLQETPWFPENQTTKMREFSWATIDEMDKKSVVTVAKTSPRVNALSINFRAESLRDLIKNLASDAKAPYTKRKPIFAKSKHF